MEHIRDALKRALDHMHQTRTTDLQREFHVTAERIRIIKELLNSTLAFLQEIETVPPGEYGEAVKKILNQLDDVDACVKTLKTDLMHFKVVDRNS